MTEATVGDERRYDGMSTRDYPSSVEEVLDPNKRYRRAALRAVKAFARSKPYVGTIAERKAKFRILNAALAAAYDLPAPRLVFETNETRDSGSSCFVPANDTIILRGRLSVVSYLHEFAHFRFGRSEVQACRWSINLFRRCFPRSWVRVTFEGHMVRAG